jgi:RNA polymerase sigma-70 factor (ECF subfamily)
VPQGSLTKSFESARPAVDVAAQSGVSGISGAELEAALAALVEAGRSAWPTISLRPEAFVAYVAERLPAAETSVERVRAADLWVACACAQGDAGAVAALDERVRGTLTDSLRRMRLSNEQIEDVLQGLRRVLFAGDEVSPPRIREYAGQGDLIGWLRVSATRSALKVLRRDKREVPDESAFEERATDGDPELHYMKALYRDAFKAAFQKSLDSLSDREKTLLRQHVVDELSIDDLGLLYQVHRATAARWLASARETLLERTRINFLQSARVSGDECESVLRLVQSQLDATIRRRLEAVG